MRERIFAEVLAVGPFQANCVLLGDREAGRLAIVDPGAEAERVLAAVAASGLEPTEILLTHAHIDHIDAVGEVRAILGGELPVALHPDDRPLYDNLPEQARLFGLSSEPAPAPTLELAHGQRLALGGLELEVRHAPGHSPGHVIFVVHGGATPLAVVGDVIFAGSIGRTDLWGGSFPTLERSIREQVYTLDPETRLLCGHGPATSVAQERATNPFVRG